MKLTISLVACLLVVGCARSHSHTKSTETVQTPKATSESHLDWRSASFEWISAWAPCKANRFTITPDQKILENNCGMVRTAEITQQELSDIELLLQPVLTVSKAPLDCTGQSIIDYSVYLFVDPNGSEQKIYSYDSTSKCAAAGKATDSEKILDALGKLEDKYLPSNQ